MVFCGADFLNEGSHVFYTDCGVLNEGDVDAADV